MELITKIFIVNLITCLFTVWADILLINNWIEKSKLCGPAGFWALCSVISIPVYFIWLIITA